MKNTYLMKPLKGGVAAWVFAALMLAGCSSSHQETVTAENFVGKWQSSKLITPVYLYKNGEWEIKSTEGAVLQYGVWTFKNKQIIWSYKIDDNIGHDPNFVLSVTPREFKLRESDGKITTFSKLD